MSFQKLIVATSAFIALSFMDGCGGKNSSLIQPTGTGATTFLPQDTTPSTTIPTIPPVTVGGSTTPPPPNPPVLAPQVVLYIGGHPHYGNLSSIPTESESFHFANSSGSIELGMAPTSVPLLQGFVCRVDSSKKGEGGIFAASTQVWQHTGVPSETESYCAYCYGTSQGVYSQSGVCVNVNVSP